MREEDEKEAQASERAVASLYSLVAFLFRDILT